MTKFYRKAMEDLKANSINNFQVVKIKLGKQGFKVGKRKKETFS